MCDCFHLAFPNWHAASSGTGAGRRLRGPEPGTEDDSICDEPPQFAEGERPRPQGSSPVEEYPETEKYSDSDKECEAEHDPHRKSGSGKKTKKSGLGSMFEKRSTPKMSKLKEVHSPESGVIVKTAKDGCAEGLVYGGGGKDGIFIKEVIPESPASKNLKLKEGDQVLSATVYFDNVSYEDAIQILEHAQAYKVKLCLKRKPDITETERTLESDVIPEDDVYAPEMREQGKTKRRGDARISWPKFPSFGKGRKSGFRRSHSSSEADEQRKLELSPTTSDTESPIKSQDALKGKKKHKIKLPTLTKRGRVSSSEDTDAPTSVQISGNVLQTHESDVLSPEGLESPSGETPEVYVTQELKEVEELRPEQNDQKLTEPQTIQHKVELITIGSTLKTEDITVALAGQESPAVKSPDGKKKKKEKSELKMKILGKDKSHKKDAKAKSSPKRLKTLGASFEIADQPENDAIPSSEVQQRAKSETMQIEMSAPKVELDTSDVAFVQKSPRKGEEKTKKGKDKQKQEAKTSPAFKLPKVGFSDIAPEETIQKIHVNVEGSTAKTAQLTTEGIAVKEDPYERLSKGSLSGAKLPKREDIEIPGMEDMSMKTKAKGIKEPKAVFAGHHEEIQAETVQLSIDVDSVKEAVSKLPGFKLPKVDDSGVPIPEEITVIDANAQRISVKTPTKVVDTKAKHETHFTKFDITASPDVSKTTIKLPKIATADLTSDEPLIETKVDVKKTEKKQKSKAKQSGKDTKTEVYEREHIIIPGKESTQEEIILQTRVTEESDKKSKKSRITASSFGIGKPDIKIPNIGIDLPKQNIAEEKINVEGERTILLKEVKTSKTETRKGKGQTEGLISDVKIPDIDGIEYIDSVDGSSAKKDGGIRFTGVGVNLEATKPSVDISLPEIRGEVKDLQAEEQTIKVPTFGVVTPDISVQVPDAEKDISIDGAETKRLQREGSGSKFKFPNFGISMPKVKGPKAELSPSKKTVDVTLPEAKAEGKLPEVPEVDITLRNVEQKIEVEKPELDIKPLQTEGEPDGQGGRFKMPKFGIKMPKIKGPEIDLSLSKKDGDISEEGANIQISDDANISMDIKQQEIEAKMDPQESKFKMPKLGITMPKTKGPEIDFSLNKKDKDLNLPEAKAEIKVPDVELKKPSAEVEITAPDVKVSKKDAKVSPSKFKMPTFKLPKFGVGMPSATAEVPDKEAKIDGADIKIPEEVLTVEIAAPSIDTEGKSIDIKTTGSEHEGKGGKFKMPKFGVTMPKVTGPEIDLSLSKKDGDVTLPDAKAEIKVPDVELKQPSAEVEITAPEIKVTTKDKEGSPSKFKMPTFKLPKFGVGMPSATAEVPDKEAKIDGADIKIPEEVLTVEIAAPSIESEGKSIDIKTTGTEHEGKGSKFKMPKFGVTMPKVTGPEIDLSLSKKDGDVTLPEAKAEVNVPDVELKKPSAEVEITAPDVKVATRDTKESPSKFKMPTFKLPKFGVGMPSATAEVPDKEAKIDGADIKIPEEVLTVEIAAPSIESEGKSIDIKTTGTEHEGKGGKFKIPKFGISLPKVKGPEIDLSVSKKDVDVTLPEAKAEVRLPEAQNVDVSLGKAEVSLPEGKLEVKKPEFEMESETELDGQGSKFKMPKLGMSMPKVKGPEIHFGLSKKDGDVTLPEAKAEVKVPEAPKVDISLGKAEVSLPEGKLEVKKPELEMESETELDGQGSKFKMPKLGMSMPKVKGPEIHFGLSKKDGDVTLPEAKAEVKVPEAPKVDISLRKAEISLPEGKLEAKKPELEMESEIEIDGQGGKFKMPKLGMSMPKVKGPEIHFGLSKKDGNVTLPEAKAEVKVPEAPKVDISLGKAEVSLPEMKMEVEKPDLEMQSEVEADGLGGKFKMPKLGMSMPKVKGPDIHFGLSKKDGDVTLPEFKADVKLPEAPKVDVSLGRTDVSIPEGKLEVKKPELEMESETELDGQGGKFKMPKLGMSMPKIKGPDIHFGLSKKDGDVTLPEVKADIKLPEAPKVDVSLGRTDVSIPEGKLEVKKPELEMESETELDGQGGKFKMPKLGMSMPKIKGPEIHFGLSKKDGNVTLPEAKVAAEVPKVELKEPPVKVEMTAPEITVPAKGTEGSPTKFKMPSFKLPKFGLGTPNVSVEAPDLDKDVKIHGGDIKIPEEAPSIGIVAPSVDIKTTATEQDGKESKFKISGLGFSMPKVKGPKIDLSLSKKDADVTFPEAKADVKLPEVKLGEVDISVPDMEVPEAKATVELPEAPRIAAEMQQPECDVEMGGQDGKFEMPKFGIKMPKIKGPEFDLSLSKKDANVKAPEVNLEKVDVSIPEAKLEVKKPELEMPSLQTEGEFDGKREHFKMPKLGLKMSKIQGPEIDLSFSKKDVDVTLPQIKTDVKLPDAPKIDVKVGKTDVSIPGAKVEGEKPDLEIKPLQTDLEGQGSKFKMPKFEMAMPKVKGPKLHTDFSKKDVDVTLPEVKADVSLSDVQLNKPSAKLEMKAPEIEVLTKDTEGSPFSMPKVEGPALRFPKKDMDITLQGIQTEAKLPGAPKVDVSLGKAEILIPEAKMEVKKPEVEIKSLTTGVELEDQEGKFKMPKLGITMPKLKGPEIDLSFSKKDADVTLPETKAEVKLPEAPKIDVTLGKVDVSVPEAKMEVEKPQMEIKPLQSEGELDGQGSKYKMPKFGISMPKIEGPKIDISLPKKDVDITLPEAEAEVSFPDVEPKVPSAEVDIKAPEAEAQLSSVKGSPSKFKMPTFKFPKFGAPSPTVIAEVPDMDKEIKSDGADMKISVPPTDVDVPKVQAEVHLPEIKVKEPSGVEVDAKLKKPRFSLPRFSFSKPSAKAPEADVSLPDVNVAIPEGKVEVKGEEVDKETPECEAEADGQGTKFKMPKFGITMPKVTGPEIDLSLSKKDGDVTLPEAKAEVKVPDVELKKPSAEVEIKAPEIKTTKKDKERSPLKLNMPTVKLPKFGVGMPRATVDMPDKEAKIHGADIKIPEEVLTVEITAPSTDMEGKSIEIKTTGTEHEGKGSKFEMPKFGITMPKVEGPQIDLNFSKKDAKAKGEIKLPDVELKEPSAKMEIKAPSIDAQSIDIYGPSLDVKKTENEDKGEESKFKVPNIGISLPKVQKPEIDVSLSKKGDIKLPEAKTEVKLPEAPKVDVSLGKAEVSIPEIKMEVEKPDLKMQSEVEADGQGGKFKMPKLGMSMPKVKGPDIHFGLSKKDEGVTLPEVKADVKLPEAPKVDVSLGKAEVSLPEGKLEVKKPELEMESETEIDGQGGKFKMPKLGMSMPKVKGPEIHFGLSKKDGDVTLPEGKAEVKVPDAELKKPSAKVEITAPEIKVSTKDKEGSPSKFKMPTFKLPKFGVGMPSATAEVPDKEAKIDGADIKIPEEVLTVEMAAPNIDAKDISIDIKTTGPEYEGKGSKFKMPKFGVTMPKVTGPEIDLSLSKKDGDVTLPEAKAEVKVPDVELKKPSAEVEITALDVKVATKDTKESPSKFKMPTFKLPKFGVGMPSATVDVPDKEAKIDGADIKIPEEVLTVEIAAPSIDTEGKSIDIKTTGTEHEGKGGKFKMPKFGVTMPKVTGPEIDLSLSKKDGDVTLPEAKAEVKVPDVELKKPSAEVEIKAPEIKVSTKDKEGSPSKFKMPTFKLPKFGVGMPSATAEVPDKEAKIDGADIKIPEEVLTVEIAAPSIDTEGKSIDIKTTGTEHEGKGGKFKMPKFGVTMPKVTGPEIDLSLSKKDGDVTLPEAKAEVKVPDVELKKPSAEMEIKAPDVKVVTKDKEGSPSKFKMPTFKLPKFGVGMPSATAEVPDKEAKIDGADIKKEEVLTVEIAAPSIDAKDKSIDIKTTGTEHEGKGSKFKMPKFGISMPKVTGPEIDLSLSKKDGDVTLPEAKAEVKVPDVELKKPSAEMEIKAPGVDIQTGSVEGSPSKFKMPTFTLPKFGGATPPVNVEASDGDKSIKVAGADIKLPEAKAEVTLPDVKMKEPVTSVSVPQAEGDVKVKKTRFSLPKFSFSKQSTTEHEVDASAPDTEVSLPGGKMEAKQPEAELKPPEGGVELDKQESKFKMPKFGISMPKVKGPEISKKDGDISLPETKADVQLPGVEIKQSSTKVEIKSPEIEAQAGNVEKSPLNLKMPSLTLPRFGADSSKVSVKVPDVDKDIKTDGANLSVPKKGATVDVTATSTATEGLSVDVKAKESESKFKMPSFGISMPKVKGPEIDLSASKKDVDVKLPEVKAEVKLPSVKEPEAAKSVPDEPQVEAEAKSKKPNWTFPKFSFSRTGGKAPDADVNLEASNVGVISPEAKAEACLPNVEVQGPSGAISVEEPPAVKAKFSLPRFSFSKSSGKEPEDSVDVSLPQEEVIVKQPEMEIKTTEPESGQDVQGSKFKLPKFGITLPKTKGPEEDLNAAKKDTAITLPEVKAEVKLPQTEVKKSSASVEIEASDTEAKSKDVGGSPSKFKMPTVKMPKFGVATSDVTVGTPDAKVDETDGAKLKDTVGIKGVSVDVKSDVSKAAITDPEVPKTETDGAGLGSPSKFKLFKMPKLSFSRSKPEEESAPAETENKEDQMEMEDEQKGESKSPKVTLTSFGDILKNFDVEFDIPKTENVEEPGGNQLEEKEKEKEKETNTKQEAVKSPERTGWFKFPKFGLSSPSEPAKTPEKDKDEKSPTADEEISPTSSVRSSDAFADVSSAVTSEHAGLSLSSPTKVTVKYSDSDGATGHGEMHSNIITSTTRTEMISVEPNLPEKITILSSGVSSSSEDTLRLDSGKIHVITSNIQATPEAQHAKLLAAIQVQPAGQSDASEAASWTVEESKSGKRTVFERHVVRETSSQKSESKETIVITKQITRMLDSSEPISGETASSIQRLKDSVHSEKMKFFDGAEK